MLPAEAVVHESPVLSQLTPGKVHRNLSVPQMVAVSLARGESKLAANGALVAYTVRVPGAPLKTNSSFRMTARARW